MFKHIDYVTVGVSDMKRSVEFYRDKLGMTLKFESGEWTEFQTGPTTLALHLSKPRDAPSISRGEIIARTSMIGFTVDDLDRTYKELRARNVKFIMEPTAREEERIKLAVCLDPDDLEISLAEALKNPFWAEAPTGRS